MVYPDICHVAASTTEIMARETPTYGLASPPRPMWPRKVPKPDSGWMYRMDGSVNHPHFRNPRPSLSKSRLIPVTPDCALPGLRIHRQTTPVTI